MVSRGGFSTHSLFAKKSGLKNQVAFLLVIVCIELSFLYFLGPCGRYILSVRFSPGVDIPDEVDLLYTYFARNIAFWGGFLYNDRKNLRKRNRSEITAIM